MSKPEVENFSLLDRIFVSLWEYCLIILYNVVPAHNSCKLWFSVSTSGPSGTPSYLAPLDFDFFICSVAVLWPLS